MDERRLAVQITVTGRHVDVPDDVRDYASEKAEKLLRFYDRIQSIKVVVDSEGDEMAVEMIVNAGARNEFVCSEVGPDVFALIDLTVSKLERQLTKHKEMLRNRKHPGK